MVPCGFNVMIRWGTGRSRRWSRPCRSWSCWACWPRAGSSAWKAALAGLVDGLPGGAGSSSACRRRWSLASVAVGVVFASIRIVWLIVAAVFLYDITVETGQFEVMKASVARLSADRRLQAVLVAFCFGAFIEGAAGFGAPVAISAAFLVGLGFQPFQAALLCLIANTAPVAWGGIGIPILTLSKVTGLDVHALSATSGRILPILSLVIPFWLVATMTVVAGDLGGLVPAAGHRRDVRVGSVPLVELRRLRAGRHRLVGRRASCAGVIVIRLWRPREIWRFERDAESPIEPTAGGIDGRELDARPGRAGLDAVRALDGVRAGLGDPGDQDRGDARGQGLARPAALVEARAALAASEGRQGRGGDRARDARRRRISRRPSSRSSRSRPRARPSSWRPWPAATCSACRRPGWRDSWRGPSAGWSPRSRRSSACWRWGS